MNETFLIVLSALAGLAIGMFFYGGLWLTVSRVLSAKHPGLLFAASSMVRTALALAAMWWVSQGGAVRLALCLLGFIAARPLVFRLTRELPRSDAKPTEEPRCT